MNRGLYDIAVLFDPAARPNDGLRNWNNKIVWAFGGSGGNVRRQTAPASSWMNDDALSHGFLVGVSNFTDGSRNNNRPLAAETLMMIREHVSDTYGPVRHLIGEGCSAGSMQQNVLSTMYPGLVDGVLISCSFPDSDSLMQEIVDSFLLKQYFDSPAFAAQLDIADAGDGRRIQPGEAAQLDHRGLQRQLLVEMRDLAFGRRMQPDAQ